MKPGCFIKSIVVLTVIVAVIVWIVQNRLNEFILNPGRKAIATVILKGVDKKIDMLKENLEKDSLRVLFHDLMDKKIYTFNTFSNKMFEPIKDSLEVFSEDSIIDKKELERLTELFRKIKDEGSKKN